MKNPIGNIRTIQKRRVTTRLASTTFMTCHSINRQWSVINGENGGSRGEGNSGS